VIAVPRGTTVTFPNLDTIYHNVFSLSGGNPFDLGLYRKGAARSANLKSPGVVRVYCNIHPEMAGFVVVVEGSAYAVTGGDGSYRIGTLPPGRHSVRVWNEMGGEQQASVELFPERATTWNVTLDASAYRRLPHKNKFGKDYASSGVDRY
jgi:hypothetical protein